MDLNGKRPDFENLGDLTNDWMKEERSRISMKICCKFVKIEPALQIWKKRQLQSLTSIIWDIKTCEQRHV